MLQLVIVGADAAALSPCCFVGITPPAITRQQHEERQQAARLVTGKSRWFGRSSGSSARNGSGENFCLVGSNPGCVKRQRAGLRIELASPALPVVPAIMADPGAGALSGMALSIFVASAFLRDRRAAAAAGFFPSPTNADVSKLWVRSRREFGPIILDSAATRACSVPAGPSSRVCAGHKERTAGDAQETCGAAAGATGDGRHTAVGAAFTVGAAACGVVAVTAGVSCRPALFRAQASARQSTRRPTRRCKLDGRPGCSWVLPHQEPAGRRAAIDILVQLGRGLPTAPRLH